MNKIILLLTTASLLVSCSQIPSESAIQTAIAETQNVISKTPTITPTSTVTSTPIPLADIQFDSSIVKGEDLGLEYGRVLRTIPGLWPTKGVVGGINTFSQELWDKTEDDLGGWVIISLYDSLDAFKADFEQIKQNAVGYVVVTDEDFGDESFAYDEQGRYGVVFTICEGLIFIFISWGYDMKTVLVYSKNLESRLRNVICR